MKHFKEWLSDYLRYILLFLAGALFVGIVWIGVRVYQNYDSSTAGKNIEILPEKETQQDKEQKPAKADAQTETELQTQKEQTEGQKKPASGEQSEEESETQTGVQKETDEKSKDAASQGDSDVNTDAAALAGLSADQNVSASSNGAQQSETQQSGETQPAQAETQPETQPVQTETQPPTEAQPVYMTLNQACNFRSGPGYDYEVVAEYSAGTTVEFLGMVEGWAEVQVDGMIGYMGRQFLS